MVSGAHLAEFIYASVAIILAPGPSVMFAIARAVAWGRGSAILTVLGNAFGMLLLSLVIAFGLGPLLQRSDVLLISVQFTGGLYLIYLGFDALKHRQLHADDLVTIKADKPNRLDSIRQGFMVGVLNPKALVFFSAIFPQFVDQAAGSITTQMVWFGVLFSIMAFFLDGMWAMVVGSSRDWFVKSRGRLVLLRTLGGVVMIVLGVLVIVPLIFDLAA